jgi:HEAT repeat protein
MPVSADRLPTTHEAVRNLASREDAVALNALADAAAVSDQFLRRTAIEVIGRHPRGRELSAIILGALGDSSGYVVRTACDVVAQWKLSEAHDLVHPLLANVSAATRRSAIRALGTIWADEDFSSIFHIYTNDPKIDVRREAASVLRLRASLANWRTLFDAFYRDELARHRQWACDLAEAFSSTEVLPLLLQLSSDLDGHVRKAASRAARTLSSRE